MKTITSVKAQNNFGFLMDQVIREPVTITKHGKAHVVMISYEEISELGTIDFQSLSPKTQSKVKKSRSLPKDLFQDF